MRGILAVAPSGQDTLDRVRPPCGSRPQDTRRTPTGDLRFLGIHLHLRKISTGSLPTSTEDPARPHAGEAPGNQGGAAATNAPDYPRSGTLVEASRYRPLRLLCGTHK